VNEMVAVLSKGTRTAGRLIHWAITDVSEHQVNPWIVDCRCANLCILSVNGNGQRYIMWSLSADVESPVTVVTSVSNGDKFPGQFRVWFRTRTKLFQLVLTHENPDLCKLASFTTKYPACQHPNFASD